MPLSLAGLYWSFLMTFCKSKLGGFREAKFHMKDTASNKKSSGFILREHQLRTYVMTFMGTSSRSHMIKQKTCNSLKSFRREKFFSTRQTRSKHVEELISTHYRPLFTLLRIHTFSHSLECNIMAQTHHLQIILETFFSKPYSTSLPKGSDSGRQDFCS